MSSDYIYWTFSAAAQSISAFVAILLTGYTVVLSIMDSASARDDSLEDIHKKLRISYHRRLTILAVVTGTAVIASLFVSYCNRTNDPVSGRILLIVGIIDIAAIVGGLYFVVSIVNPTKYQQVAEKELSVIRGSQESSRNSADFFNEFIHIEKVLRDYLRERDLYIPSASSPQMTYSFRRMVDALYKNEKVNRQQYESLRELNRFRNLIFHGHQERVDESVFARVGEAKEIVENLD